jgi:hypothetical protein
MKAYIRLIVIEELRLVAADESDCGYEGAGTGG